MRDIYLEPHEQAEIDAVFESALATGRLSKDTGAANYVGDYMYMGTHPKTGRAAFKHRDTREYLA